jgi:hypothetical protein
LIGAMINRGIIPDLHVPTFDYIQENPGMIKSYSSTQATAMVAILNFLVGVLLEMGFCLSGSRGLSVLI